MVLTCSSRDALIVAIPGQIWQCRIYAKRGSTVFTGLIQALGYLKPASAYQLAVHWQDPALANSLAIGDSVAVDGVCLTVETLIPQGFMVTTSPETLQRTTLNTSLETHAPVNLEPALKVGDRLGGHFVTGHIDGMGQVDDLVVTDTSWAISFRVPAAIATYIVPKGSIAVNGISLTVAECNSTGTWFKVVVIPHSFSMTNLQDLQSGSLVNLETDLLGKYVAKLMRLNLGQPTTGQPLSPGTPEITLGFLAEHGFG